MSEEDYRVAKEARADLVRRGGGSASSETAMARLVNAAIYRYEHAPHDDPHPVPPATETPRPLSRRYRRAMAEARARLDELRLAAATEFGVQRYADRGTGSPVLLVHGILGGSDAALRQLQPLVPPGFRLIAPSRFGYLGSTIPEHASPAIQADAFVALLDHLGVERAPVLAVSAGATSALQLAIRHPDRVAALLLVSPNGLEVRWPHTTLSRFLAGRTWGSNRLMWTFRRRFPLALRGLMGVPKDLRLDAADRVVVDRELDGIFPVDGRAAGALFDAFVSNQDIDSGYAFDRITAPTLIAHARDDTLVPFAAASLLADAVPGAELLAVTSGGHLMLGDQSELTAEIERRLRCANEMWHR